MTQNLAVSAMFAEFVQVIVRRGKVDEYFHEKDIN